jgi:hypothetical protein
MRQLGSDVAGYRSWSPFQAGRKKENPRRDDPTFLTGACGIALAFVGAMASAEPKWDRVLLTNISPDWSSFGFELLDLS